MFKLNFNPAASSGAVNAPKLRIRTADMGHYQELQIRPTDRASSSNMPKGELLLDIENGEVEIPEEMAAGLTNGQFLVLQDRKHGWIALVNATPLGDAPGADVKG